MYPLVSDRHHKKTFPYFYIFVIVWARLLIKTHLEMPVHDGVLWRIKKIQI